MGIRDYIMKVFQTPSDYILKQREKLLKWLAIFYEKLTMVFWVSNLDLFHALAWLRYVVHIRTFKKSVSAEDMEKFASKAVLAVLSVTLFQENSDDNDYNGDSMSNYQVRRRMASLLGHTNIPTRESLKQGLIIKGIYKYSTPKVKELYELVEGSTTPLKLCSKSIPLLEFVSSDPYLAQYLPKLKEIIFHKLLLQLSKVYFTIKIDYFTSQICPKEFYEWHQAETVLIDLAYRGLLPIRLDYTNRIIQMKNNELQSRSGWYELARCMLKCMGKIGTANTGGMSAGIFAEAVNVEACKAAIPQLRQEHLDRMKMIERRRLEHQEQLMRDEEARCRQEIEEKLAEERIETIRREEALKQFELQRKIEEKVKLKSETAKQMLDEIKKLGAGQSSKIYIKGKQLEDINVQDVLDGLVDYDDLEKAREAQRIRDRQEKYRQRRAEAKKMDHLIRAVREKEMELIEEYKSKVLERDKMLLAEAQARREEKYANESAALEEEKRCLALAQDVKKLWVSRKLEEMRPIVEQKRAEQLKRLIGEIKAAKIARSRLRYLEHQKEMEMEAKRIHQEMDGVGEDAASRFNIFDVDSSRAKESPIFYRSDPSFQEAIFSKSSSNKTSSKHGSSKTASKTQSDHDIEKPERADVKGETKDTRAKEQVKRTLWRPNIAKRQSKNVDEDDDWRRK